MSVARDVMVDLETLGDGAGCVPLSIGAVAFDAASGWTDPEGFYTTIDRDSCICAGLRYDQSTRDWWNRQSAEAQSVLTASQTDLRRRPLTLALMEFGHYLARFGGRDAVRVWGNGADFDNAIIAYACKAVGLPPPWDHWNSRCFRTLKNLRRDVPAPPRVGVFHNALDDARTQALHAVELLAAISGVAATRQKEEA